MRQIPFTLILTGPSGVGKTKLAKQLAESDTRFRYVSLTDEISNAIKAATGSSDSMSNANGVEFIEHYGPEIYARVLLDVATPGTILDGVRLPLALQLLELSGIQYYHIHLRNRYVHAQQPDPSVVTEGMAKLDELADLCLANERVEFNSPANLESLIGFISSFGYAQTRWPMTIAA